MNRKREIIHKRTNEVVRATQLFGQALFGRDPGAFFQEKGEELERELAQRGAIVVEGHAVDEGKGSKGK